ncbi:light harvesting complex protein 3 precursor [Baffinella frigidus]|nr:light harvesting complex protein 3 precursor [Cryptophyta sp. CCMP2293]
MLRNLLVVCGLAAASAFSAPSVLPRANVRASVAKGPSMQAMSEAIPFLPKPKNIDDSMAGYSGFDPMGFSDYYDVKYLREAEIKHGRICMLAVVGMFHPEIAKFPQFESFSTNPLQAFYECPAAGWVQIFVFLGIVESFSYEKIFYTENAPGDLGFDPLGVSGDASRAKHYARAEIMNGRLAMIGFSGMLHHAILTKMGPFEQIASQTFYPIGAGFK